LCWNWGEKSPKSAKHTSIHWARRGLAIFKNQPRPAKTSQNDIKIVKSIGREGVWRF